MPAGAPPFATLHPAVFRRHGLQVLRCSKRYAVSAAATQSQWQQHNWQQQQQQRQQQLYS
jgi:hypothetical protein